MLLWAALTGLKCVKQSKAKQKKKKQNKKPRPGFLGVGVLCLWGGGLGGGGGWWGEEVGKCDHATNGEH